MKQFFLAWLFLLSAAQPALADKTLEYKFQGDVLAESGENQRFIEQKTLFGYKLTLTLNIKNEGNSTLSVVRNGQKEYVFQLKALSPTEFELLPTEEGYVYAGQNLVLSADQSEIVAFYFNTWGYNYSDAVLRTRLIATGVKGEYFFSYYWGDDANYRENGIVNAK